MAIKAIATTQRKDRKMDDSGEGERIFRLQMSHYLNFYAAETPATFEDPLNVNDFLGLLHSVRATRRWKKRGQQLLTLLHQIAPPAAENEPLEHTLINHYYRACFFWHFFWIDGAEKPATLGQVGSKAASVLKPARYFFQQMVSAKILRRRKRSTFDLARPFASAFATTLQMITEIIESDKLLKETVWNYGMFMNALNGCISYTAPGRRTTWVLRLRRLVSTASGPVPVKNKTRRQQRNIGVRSTRRAQRCREPSDADFE